MEPRDGVATGCRSPESGTEDDQIRGTKMAGDERLDVGYMCQAALSVAEIHRGPDEIPRRSTGCGTAQVVTESVAEHGCVFRRNWPAVPADRP